MAAKKCKTVQIKGRGNRRCMCPDRRGRMRFAKNRRCGI